MLSYPLAVLVGPLGILLVTVVFIVVAIAVCRLHAFFALILAAGIASVLTAAGQSGDQRYVKAIESAMSEMGSVAGKIGFSIALAAVIGVALMDSGAADKIIRRFIAVLGEGRAAIALLACSYLLAAPVFVDTVFMLLLPLARALALRTGRNYLLYVLCIGAGGSVANGLIPPAPGALVVSDMLKLDVGFTMIYGAALGIVPAFGAYFVARWFNARQTVPVRPLAGSSIESLQALAARPEAELPGFFAAIAPVVLPVLLIAGASMLTFVKGLPPGVIQLVSVLGNKNVALLVGAIIAVSVSARQRGLGWRQVGDTLGRPLETAGVIILITSAGAAFGAMIKNAGVSEAARALASHQSLNFVLLTWAIAAFVRAAQGSATVATITATSIVISIAGTGGFGVHPIYIFAASGLGSKFLPWMNDSGFWVFSRLGGLNQNEMLRSWSLVASIVSVFGLIEILIVSQLWPNLPF